MDNNLAKKVVTLGVDYNPPKGGIAQVLSIYHEMYPTFNYIATVKGENALSKLFTLFIAVSRFIGLCLTGSVRIVHIHGGSNTSFYRKAIFIYLARFMGKRVVYHVHGGGFEDFYRANPTQVKRVFGCVDTVIALSESWKVFFEKELGHKQVRVIENVVFPPTSLPVARDEYVRFLFLGLLNKNKGIYDLIDAISLITKELRSHKVIFHIGGNGELEQVKEKIKHLGLDDLVILEGWVSGFRKEELMIISDVFILPSYVEGLPISILEAMSYGLPVISTLVGGIPEIVFSGDNGILLEPGDKKALAHAILRLTGGENFRKRAGESSFQKVQPYFPAQVATKLESVYRELLYK